MAGSAAGGHVQKIASIARKVDIRALVRAKSGEPAGISSPGHEYKTVSRATIRGVVLGSLRSSDARPSIHLLHHVERTLTAVAGSVPGRRVVGQTGRDTNDRPT